jgi:pyrimidine deaminase RibD-like protein
MESEHARFMKVALEEAALAKAEGNIGVGSVIVRDGVVVERGHEKLLEMTGRSIEIVSWVLHDECASVYLDSVRSSSPGSPDRSE